MTYVGWSATAGAGGFHPLSIPEQLYWGSSHVGILTWEDITAGIATATSLTLGLTAPIAGQLWQCDFFRLITPFANANNAAQNSTQIELGDNESANRYLANTEFNLNGAYVPIGVGTGYASAHAYTAADIVQAVLAAPAAGLSLSNLTQGEARFYFRVRDNNQPS
jgi:hypothetical protein